MKRIALGILAVLGLSTAMLLSQNGATVSGVVQDQTTAGIAGATVELRALPNGASRTVTSDSTGKYSFASVTAGEYELKASSAGFRTYVEKIKVGKANFERNIVLQVGSAAESVVVSEISPERLPGRVSEAVAPPPRATVIAGQQGGKGGGGGGNMASRALIDQSGPDSGYRRVILPPGMPMPLPNSEEYGRWVENEFTTPTNAPLSTFGADVDTASYANVRRFLNERQLPPVESVRIEELVNYFTYEYPLPERGKPVSVVTNLTASPWNPGRQLLHIGLRTTPLATEDLPPSSLTFLIDVSGSMNAPDKLPLVKQALSLLIKQLRAQDHVSLVVYAGNSGVVLPPTSGSQRDLIQGAIDRLGAGGSTHGSAGLRLAYRMARDGFLKNGNNRVILATDGDFNVGVTSDAELVRLIEDERKSGVFLSVLGFGTGNLKDSKMEKLADHGNGNYAYIDTLSEARKVFVQEMGATLYTVAKDVKLQIEFNPTRVKEYRLIGYENRLLRPEDFNDDTKDAGDLGAGHQVTAFYEIVPVGASGSDRPSTDALRYQQSKPVQQPAAAASHADELGWIKLRYKAPQSESSQLLEWPISATASAFDRAPREVRFAAAVAEYGILLRNSKFAGHAAFDHVLATASSALGSDLEGHRTAFLDLVRTAQHLSAPRRN